MSDLTIDFDYNTKKPIAVKDYVNALSAFEHQVNKQLQKNELLKSHDIALEIVSIESGSLKAKLKPFAIAVLALAAGYNEVVDAVTNVNSMCSYLAKESSEKPVFDRQDMEDVKSIINPVVKEGNSNIYIVAKDNSTVKVEFNASWQRANTIYAQATKEIKKLEAPMKVVYDKVMLNIEEAVNKTKKGDVGDKGVIETISESPAKLYFVNPDIKKTVLENPFRKSYMVKVEADFILGEPKRYKITELYEVVDR